MLEQNVRGLNRVNSQWKNKIRLKTMPETDAIARQHEWYDTVE